MATTKTPEGWIDVTVDNPAGQTVTVRLPDDEQGHDLADTLRKRARREELERVEVAVPQYRPRPQAIATRPVRDVVEAEGTAPADDLDALRAEYEQRTGQVPDSRWKAPRLRRALDELGTPDGE